jgi:hypothetical protein
LQSAGGMPDEATRSEIWELWWTFSSQFDHVLVSTLCGGEVYRRRVYHYWHVSPSRVRRYRVGTTERAVVQAALAMQEFEIALCRVLGRAVTSLGRDAEEAASAMRREGRFDDEEEPNAAARRLWRRLGATMDQMVAAALPARSYRDVTAVREAPAGAYARRVTRERRVELAAVALQAFEAAFPRAFDAAPAPSWSPPVRGIIDDDLREEVWHAWTDFTEQFHAMVALSLGLFENCVYPYIRVATAQAVVQAALVIHECDRSVLTVCCRPSDPGCPTPATAGEADYALRPALQTLCRPVHRSDSVAREWKLARQEGRRVSPVSGPGELDFSHLPRWMGRAHRHDIDIPESRARLVRRTWRVRVCSPDERR